MPDAKKTLMQVLNRALTDNAYNAEEITEVAGHAKAEEFHEVIQGFISVQLAGEAAVQLKRALLEFRDGKALDPDNKRYIDLLFGVLDRAGFTPHRPQGPENPRLNDLDVDDLAALRSQVNSLLAARAKRIDAQEKAQEPPVIEANILNALEE